MSANKDKKNYIMVYRDCIDTRLSFSPMEINIKLLWQRTIKNNPSITNNPIYFQLTFLLSEKVCVEFHRNWLISIPFSFLAIKTKMNENSIYVPIAATWVVI